MTNLSLTPLFRQSVGFDRLGSLLQTVFDGEETSTTSAYPPYNIEKHGENSYIITMALAGFKDEDISIVLQNDHLTVSGRIQNKKEEKNVEYLYRGIATRSFERTFQLADHMQVTNAKLNDGMLKIQIIREIPEAMKPRLIPVNGKQSQIEVKSPEK